MSIRKLEYVIQKGASLGVRGLRETKRHRSVCLVLSLAYSGNRPQTTPCLSSGILSCATKEYWQIIGAMCHFGELMVTTPEVLVRASQGRSGPGSWAQCTRQCCWTSEAPEPCSKLFLSACVCVCVCVCVREREREGGREGGRDWFSVHQRTSDPGHCFIQHLRASIICTIIFCFWMVCRFPYIFYFLLYWNLFIFNWRIIVLQYCVCFCQISAWINHR